MSIQCPVVLVGLPDAGRPKVGRLLVEWLCVDHIGTDTLVVEREGRPIVDIFAIGGGAAFHVMEIGAVADAPTYDAVMPLGGGVAATPAVREFLSKHTVVYIDTPHEKLACRTALKTHQPLLAGDPSGTLARLCTEWESHYRSVATIVVESGAGPVDDIVTAIVQQLEHA